MIRDIKKFQENPPSLATIEQQNQKVKSTSKTNNTLTKVKK